MALFNLELLQTIGMPMPVKEPTPVDDNTLALPDEITLVSVDGQLLPVEDLATEDLLPPAELPPGVLPSVENFEITPTLCAPGNKPSEEPPPPAIMSTPSGMYIAYLYGACAPTVGPLLHILANAGAEDIIQLEINSPFLPLPAILSVASAIESSMGKIIVNLVPGQNMATLLIYLSATEGNLLDGAQIFQPLAHFATGSPEEMESCIGQLKEYSDFVFESLVQAKLLTDDEVTGINNDSNIFALTTRELKARMAQ